MFHSDLAQPLYAHNWFKECCVRLTFVLGVCKGN